MNLLNKQYWQNNLWFGENSREKNKVAHARDLLDGATFDERAAFFSVFATPGQTYVLGMDDSHWGGELDFTNTYKNGMRFAIFKVMDGTIATKYWEINRPKAIQAGLIVGEYAWLYRDANVSCKAQAQAVWERIKDQPKQLPLTIDFEWTNWAGSPSYPTYTDLDIWVTEFTRLSGYKPMLYSAAGYMNRFGAMPSALRNKFSRFWLANYGVSTPTLPLGFNSWDFWQFASTLEQEYYAPSSTNKKELDGNYWYARLEDLQALANVGGTIPDPDPGNGDVMETHEGTIKQTLNVRAGPGTNYDQKLPPLGYLLTGDKVYGVLDTSTSWFHFGRIVRKSGAIEIFDAWASAALWSSTAPYMSVVPYSPDVDPDPDPVTLPAMLKGFDAAGTEIPGAIWDKRNVS